MYHEEKVINEVLHWRANPNDGYTLYTPEQLTAKLLKEKERSYLEGKQFERERVATILGLHLVA